MRERWKERNAKERVFIKPVIHLLRRFLARMFSLVKGSQISEILFSAFLIGMALIVGWLWILPSVKAVLGLMLKILEVVLVAFISGSVVLGNLLK